MGLDGALRAKGNRFLGILNGIDPDVWDPSTDPALAAPFSRDAPAGKAACRRDLLERVGFDPDDDGVVLGMIGRLDPQKGFDLLADGTPALLAAGARVIVQGSGNAELADPFRALAAAQPDAVALIERFDRDMARRIYAGVDLFLMPSRFEPSGQGQMIAMRYGTPPVVRRTGGLADSVIDVTARPAEGTGFVFDDATPAALVAAVERAARLRATDATAWAALRDRAMAADFRWDTGPGAALPGRLRAGDRASPRGRLGRPDRARSARAAAPAPGVRESGTRPTRAPRPARREPMPRQFVVQVTNQPGQLAILAEQMAASGVDLRAIGGGGIGDLGHMIMTTADDDTARRVLEDGGWTYFEGESLLAEVDDRPGGMARLARELADAGVNVHGHLFLGRWSDRATFAFVVDDPEKARPILERR